VTIAWRRHRNRSAEADGAASRPQSTRAARRAPRGQVLVLFAFLLTILVGMAAFVVDIAWIWSNQLRVQRAADAAALAGVVHLPGNPSLATTTALSESQKNGYQDGVGSVDVVAAQDASNGRRMLVTVSAPVNTFFMRLFGFPTVTVSRDAKAEYVLPVPMGSPQNYYGVGIYESVGAGAITDTGFQPLATAVTPWTWSNADRASTSNDSYATATGTSAWQSYDFNMGIPAGRWITGLEVEVEAKSSDSSGCRAQVRFVNPGSPSGFTLPKETNLTGSDPASPYYLLGNPQPEPWERSDGSNATWSVDADGTTTFRLQIRGFDPGGGCTNNSTTSLDRVRLKVYYQGFTGGDTTLSVNEPISPFNPLNPQGFWGAVFTSGGVRENGDRYAPSFIGGGTGAPFGDPNPNYDPDGYDYTVEFEGGGSTGQIQLFDPMFCATGPNGSNWYGAGDHWTGHPGGTTIAPVHVTYRLYNTNGSPYNEADDSLVTTLTYNPGSNIYGDFSGQFGTPSNFGMANAADCSTNPAHNRWVPLASSIPDGVYRVNVNTTLAGANLNTGAENLFSIWVDNAGTKARVYGGGRMAAYTNQETGIQSFYLAQIEGVHAGKTMIIELFDPGESSGNAFLRIQTPENGNNYQYATFSWVSDDGRSGNNVTQIQTSNGSALFNNRLITISIPLPTSYGSTDLMPAGETEAGWWKIEYETSASNDTTTWEVSIQGNPVHLIVP
jgi:Flp pilus assembly protein TadG